MRESIVSKYLVIVESPNKIKKIKSFLGKDFEVCASVGHIRDLPPKKFGINIKKDFEPTYEIQADKKDVVKKIQQLAKKAEMIYIATDLDREGEGIAKHISDILPKDKPFKRIVYGSVTKSVVQKAVEEAGDINYNMVNSYECRRILDRIVGWKCSFPTKQATGGTSAGRVQSAALRIIAEREKEIQGFIPQEYWPIEVDLERGNGERVTATIKVPKPLDIKTGDEANTIIEILKKKAWHVSKYETQEKSTKAYPPFTTSTLYQSSSSILSWGSKKTAQVSQTLYELGLCTYIRSDSTFIVPEIISAMRDIIPTKYGDTYLPSKANVFFNKANAQEAHEAIRVTDLTIENVSGSDENKLYHIIWKRTMASQVANLIQFVGTVEFKCDKYIFGATGSKVIFEGWRKVWDYGSLLDTVLPEFVVGEELKLINVRTEQKFTTPPPRYTESSLTKELEKRGIGRPSTYAAVPDTLFSRGYIEKKKNTIFATEMGIRVSDFLVASDFCFVDLDFTSHLESDLDRIAKAEVNKLDILNHFWNRLKSDIVNATKKRDEDSKTNYKCKKCDGYLVKKFSKYGSFYSCENRSNKQNKCDYKCQIGENGEPIESPKIELEESSFLCSNCHSPLIKRTSKKGWQYLGCKNWHKDDNCKGFYDKETGKEIVFKKKKKWKKSNEQ
jgi:DNA topoisomerase-1